MSKSIVRRLAPAALLLCVTAAGAAEFSPLKLSFGRTPPGEGFTPCAGDTIYDAARGYGFEPGAKVGPTATRVIDSLTPNSVSADTSFYFSARVPEGNYRVTLWLGDVNGEVDMAVKAETRRIVLPMVRTKRGEIAKVECTINIHTPKIDDKTSVNLNDREKSPNVRHWDDKLTLEFVGKKTGVSAVSIEKVDDAVTVFLAGDSTVTDQGGEPWAAWGQFLPQFFSPKVAVANYAESGRTLRSFKGDRRWAKILSQIKAGDYVFIQFGHNDMKEKGDGVGAFTTFSESLRQYVADVRGKGGLPVVMTPMHRRRFANGQIQPTFGDYPDAIRKVAEEVKAPLIDLQAMSKPLFEFYGPDKSKRLFVHFPANSFPGQAKALADDTHFQAFGADQLARCVVQGIRDLKLPLADDLRDGVPVFDPAHPDDPDAYDLPASVAVKTVVPEGK